MTRAVYALTIWIDPPTPPYTFKAPHAKPAYLVFGLEREAVRAHARLKVEAMRKVGLQARDIDYDLARSQRMFPTYAALVERPTPCTEHFDRHFGPDLDTGAVLEISCSNPEMWWERCERECCKAPTREQSAVTTLRDLKANLEGFTRDGNGEPQAAGDA